MYITTHAKVRALERLFDMHLEGQNDEEKLYSDQKSASKIGEFLKKLIKPSMGFNLEGAKYQARIDGFDKYRAVIQVKNEQHHLITIVPIY